MEAEDLEKMNYKERNMLMYDMLKYYRICVIPSNKIESLDKLPHFFIIETSLKDIKRQASKKKRARGETGSPDGEKK